MLWAAAVTYAATAPTLLSLDGARINPAATSNLLATVLLFTRTDCPISNRYAPEVERRYETYRARGVAFWLVYLDASETEDAIRKHTREYGYNFGALLDRKHELARWAQASVTPEAVVIVCGSIVYRGLIDDRYARLGKARIEPSRRDLNEVLDALSRGAAVAPRTTRATGCFIEDAP